MKLIEAMKNLKTVAARIAKNSEQIKEYCAYVHPETPQFGDHDKQTQEVAALVQSNLDLTAEYLRLKTAIEHTNLTTKVNIGERTHTISELITIRRVSGVFVTGTYQSLNQQRAVRRMQEAFNKPGGINVTEPPRVVPVWDEKEKNAKLLDWENFLAAIDGKLEVVNAETELLHYHQ